jgi:signal transduction histidine kinase
VRFEVTDTGVGIPHAYQSRVFDKFFRVPGASGGAAGLGLSIVKEIVEEHDGEIGLKSEEGEGSTFWFTLPCTTTNSTEEALQL